MRESQIEKKVNEYADLMSIEHRKFTSPGKRGVPDQLYFSLCVPAFLIEFKQRGKAPNPKQEREITKLRARGIRVGVIDNVDDGIQFINDCLAEV